MHKKLLEEMRERVEHLERRPLMYVYSDTYESLSALICGYFLGLDTTLKMDLNKQFADWILVKATRPSQTWAECILHFLADGDEVAARRILFAELKVFLEDLTK